MKNRSSKLPVTQIRSHGIVSYACLHVEVWIDLYPGKGCLWNWMSV